MLSSVEQAFVGRDEKRAPLKMLALQAMEPVEWPLFNIVGKKLLTLLPTFTCQKRRRRNESTEASLEAIHHHVHQVEADHLQEVISTIFGKPVLP